MQIVKKISRLYTGIYERVKYMNGIDTYYYSKIIKRQRSIRNSLILFLENDEEDIILTLQKLAVLFLTDHDNIDKERYNDSEMELIIPIVEAFLMEQDVSKTLNKNEAKLFVDLALNKKLPCELNKKLAIKIAQEYNEEINNPIIEIDIEILSDICDSLYN